MTGTVVVHAEPPGIRRARGAFGVTVDGARVGQVGHGSTARFPVAAGAHTVRVTAKDGTRSNTVTVEVVEGREVLVTSRSTGLAVAILLPLLAGIAVPAIYAVAAVLLTGALFHAVPGLMFRVRAEVAPELRSTRAAEPAGESGGQGQGLWWESDPALAKRFRKEGGA
ncbi:hypothetical protein [Kitasatospora sp. NPDC057015]|uniref:hypothetical protein n=1 Tax=Kitasatospora sp. NPDC057015 TaxID=3346001 RepID=UPI0036406717